MSLCPAKNIIDTSPRITFAYCKEINSRRCNCWNGHWPWVAAAGSSNGSTPTWPNGPRYTEGSLEAPTALMLLLELTRPKVVRPFTGDGATVAAADMDSFGGIAIPLIACILYQTLFTGYRCKRMIRPAWHCLVISIGGWRSRICEIAGMLNVPISK